MATVCMENTVWRARAEKPVRRLLSYCNTREREREKVAWTRVLMVEVIKLNCNQDIF